MEVIADSSATRTEWVIIDGNTLVERAFTSGMNPYFQSRRELSRCIRLELPESFFKHRWSHVYFYGSGCANQEKKNQMASSLVAQFRSPVTVESDLLGAARGLWVHETGIACIIGTGSNSCQYNGEEIVKNVPPLGYILGDEGSSAYLGKVFLADLLKGLAPPELAHNFYDHFSVTHNMLMDEVYACEMPSRALARYGMFLADHLDSEYVRKLIHTGFDLFFKRNICAYDYRHLPIGVVGHAAVKFKKVLEDVAADFGVKLAKIIPSSIPGLIQYHGSN